MKNKANLSILLTKGIQLLIKTIFSLIIFTVGRGLFKRDLRIVAPTSVLLLSR